MDGEGRPPLPLSLCTGHPGDMDHPSVRVMATWKPWVSKAWAGTLLELQRQLGFIGAGLSSPPVSLPHGQGLR